MSEGPKGNLEKMVVISSLKNSGYYNFGFGDMRPDGNVDDRSETNNGDLIRVFSNVIFIMEEFLNRNADCTLYFAGSTTQRTVVYNMIFI